MKRRRNQRQVEPRPPCSPEAFVAAWQASASLAEVAQRVGARKNACRMRAWRYRKMGVPLKVFPPPVVEEPDPHYWDKLAEYARSLLPTGEREQDEPPEQPPGEQCVDPPPVPDEAVQRLLRAGA